VRVLHVTGSYPPTSFNTGPPQQVHRLARELRALGVDVRVATTNADGPATLDVPANRWTEHEGVPVFYGRRWPGTQDLSWTLWRAVVRETPAADLVHVTGIFGWFNLAVDRVAHRRAVPVLVSPRGSLDPGARAFSARKKAWFARLGGDRALRRAAGFHVTSDMERAHVEAAVPAARTRLVPNAVDVPSDDDLVRWLAGSSGAPYVLFLGRIHAKKNVVTLVRAWSSIRPDRGNTRLVIAGPDDHRHLAEVARVVAEEGVGDSVDLVGRISGDAKNRLVARASCLVLPSRTENFGNVVAEALACRVPVVASTGTPWRGLREHACGWWVEPSRESLAAAIGDALRMDTAMRVAMGERGRRWMADAFSWPSVARAMADFYLDLVSRRGGKVA
jgi:glycosyltransferase involved in cell wall biosynthesis